MKRPSLPITADHPPPTDLLALLVGCQAVWYAGDMNQPLSQPQQRAYRYRFYPTPAQAATLARTFDCARYVYNWALRLRMEAYQERQEHRLSGDLRRAHGPETAARDGLARRGAERATATSAPPS